MYSQCWSLPIYYYFTDFAQEVWQPWRFSAQLVGLQPVDPNTIISEGLWADHLGNPVLAGPHLYF